MVDSLCPNDTLAEYRFEVADVEEQKIKDVRVSDISSVSNLFFKAVSLKALQHQKAISAHESTINVTQLARGTANRAAPLRSSQCVTSLVETTVSPQNAGLVGGPPSRETRSAAVGGFWNERAALAGISRWEALHHHPPDRKLPHHLSFPLFPSYTSKVPAHCGNIFRPSAVTKKRES